MTDTSRYDLTSGGISGKLIRLSLPAIAGQLTQSLYSIADMAWLGRLENGAANAVAASGSVTTLIWLSMTLKVFGVTGAQIGVSQNLGAGKPREAAGFAKNALMLSVVLGVFCGVLFIAFRGTLVGLFGITDARVHASAVTYLVLLSFGIPFTYTADAAAAVFNASGNSKTPFLISVACLALNAALDPILIFTFNMGVFGAAAATAFCQVLSCAATLAALKRFNGITPLCLPSRAIQRQIYRWGVPVAFECFCFVAFVIVISRKVASFGANAMAVQRIGNQVDQFSYLVAGGFATALTAYIGQNCGAGHMRRVYQGIRISTVIMGAWGIITTLNLLLFNRLIFKLLVPREPVVVEMGAQYLRIFALCQFAACLEGVGIAVCRGKGKTFPTSVNTVASGVLRVFLAFTLTRESFGLRQNGVWWSISVSSLIRGMGAYLLGLRYTLRETCGISA